MIYNYTNFVEKIFEAKKGLTLKFIMSDSFRNAIKNIYEETANNIADELLKIESYEQERYPITFINITDSGDTVSYLLSSKYLEFKDDEKDEVWNKKRSTIKIGRFIKKVFEDEFDNLEIEEFGKLYKAEITSDKTFEKFSLVKGEDIRKWYDESRYDSDEGGSLRHSCMRYNSCQKFLDIYTESKNVSMLIWTNDDDKLLGRAIVWKLNNHNNVTFMDRIYTSVQSDESVFKKYARKMGWAYKQKQSYCDRYSVIYNGKELDWDNMEVEVKNISYEYYPYMDTFSYYDEDGILYNYKPRVSCIELDDTEGGPNNEEGMVQDYQGDMIREDEAIYCEYEGVWCYESDAIWLEYRSEYCTPRTETAYCDYTDMTYLFIDTVRSHFHSCRILEDDAVEVIINKEGDTDFYHKNDENFIEHDNKYYDIEFWDTLTKEQLKIEFPK